MENCLVTKLKGTVSADLPKFGVLQVKVANEELTSAYQGYLYLKVIQGKTCTINLVSGAMYSDSAKTNPINSKTVISVGDVFLDRNSVIEISNKYNISSIRFGSRGIINVKDLDYLNNGENVRLEYTIRGTTPSFVGDLGKLNTKIVLCKNSDVESNAAFLLISQGTTSADSFSKLIADTGVRLVSSSTPEDLAGISAANVDFAQALLNIENIENATIEISYGAGFGTVITGIRFNLDLLSDFTNFVRFNINAMRVSGDKTAFLKRNIGLTEVGFTSENYEISSVLDYWASQGKTGTCDIYGNVTVNGNKTRRVTFSGGSWTDAPI